MLAGFNQSFILRRATQGQYVDGYWQSSFVDTTIEGSIQPTSQNDMQLLPEGRRGQEAYTLYTALPINIASDIASRTADRVLIYGREFEAVHREKWQNGIIPHYKTVVVKLLEQEV